MTSWPRWKELGGSRHFNNIHIWRDLVVRMDVNQVIKEAMQAQLDHFKEEIRILRAEAWKEGYAAGSYDERLESNTLHTNPYLKENDTGGDDAGDSSTPA